MKNTLFTRWTAFVSSPATCFTPKTYNWTTHSSAPATTGIPNRPSPLAHASSRASLENGQYLAGAHCYEYFINLSKRSKED